MLFTTFTYNMEDDICITSLHTIATHDFSPHPLLLFGLSCALCVQYCCTPSQLYEQDNSIR